MPTLKINGVDLAYGDEGKGAPLVLLHGYPFNRAMWREQVDYFKDSFRIVTPDFRGLGESSIGISDDSSRPGSAPTTMEAMANDLAALLDSLGLERVILGGLSMGGYVTFAFCRDFPERVQALILADTRPQSDTAETRRNRESQAEKIVKEGMDSIVDGFLEKALAPETLRSKPLIVERVRRMITGANPSGAAGALRGMAIRRDQTDLLHLLKVPSLIVVGSEDQATPPSDAAMMNRLIAGSKMKILEGAGHVSNIESPEDFNRALQQFFRTL